MSKNNPDDFQFCALLDWPDANIKCALIAPSIEQLEKAWDAISLHRPLDKSKVQNVQITKRKKQKS